jgi:hypothetical protein
LQSKLSDFEQKNPQQPETVNEAVERLVSELPLKDITAIADR